MNVETTYITCNQVRISGVDIGREDHIGISNMNTDSTNTTASLTFMTSNIGSRRYIQITYETLNKLTIKRNELISITYLSWYTFFRSLATRETNTKDRSLKNLKRTRKKGYRHVPHSEKPHQIVAKRNARERNRVQAVNQAFSRLQKALPLYNKVLLKI